METTKDTIVSQATEPCAMDDDYEALFDASLSDEEILMLFLKEGCDLDGSPLVMVAEVEPAPIQPSYQNRTLH